MRDPNPLRYGKYNLRRTDRPTQAKDDGYKISVLMFMVYDKQEAVAELRMLPQVPAKDDKGEDILRNGKPVTEARNHRYIGVRQADMKKASANDTRLPLIAYTDNRFGSMLSALVKLKLIKKSRWGKKKWGQDRYYYTLTKDGETIWGELMKMQNG